MFFLNIPLLIWAFFKISKELFFKSIIGTIILAIFIDLLDTFKAFTEDRLLACIYGGILNGIGTALVLKATASTGGTDLLTYIVRKYKPHFQTATLIVVVDTIIVLLLSFLFLQFLLLSQHTEASSFSPLYTSLLHKLPYFL